MAKGKTLREHAAYELTRAGLVNNPDSEARKVASDTMALITRFEKQSHTDVTKEYVLDFFQRLCEFIPLTSLTDDPKEWEEFTLTKESAEKDGEKITEKRWMSKRSPRIMSADGGKTWLDMPTGKTGTSEDHVEWEKKREQAEKDMIAAADSKKTNPIGHVNPSVPESTTKPKTVKKKTPVERKLDKEAKKGN